MPMPDLLGLVEVDTSTRGPARRARRAAVERRRRRPPGPAPAPGRPGSRAPHQVPSSASSVAQQTDGEARGQQPRPGRRRRRSVARLGKRGGGSSGAASGTGCGRRLLGVRRPQLRSRPRPRATARAGPPARRRRRRAAGGVAARRASVRRQNARPSSCSDARAAPSRARRRGRRRGRCARAARAGRCVEEEARLDAAPAAAPAAASGSSERERRASRIGWAVDGRRHGLLDRAVGVDVHAERALPAGARHVGGVAAPGDALELAQLSEALAVGAGVGEARRARASLVDEVAPGGAVPGRRARSRSARGFGASSSPNRGAPGLLLDGEEVAGIAARPVAAHLVGVAREAEEDACRDRARRGRSARPARRASTGFASSPSSRASCRK